MNPDQIEQAIDELHTLGDFLRWGVTVCNEAGVEYAHGTDNAWDEVTTLILHALHLPHDTPREVMATRLTSSERHHLTQLFSRRVNERIPTPYLTNEAWFANLPFYVDERVIIPRSPIAELIKKQFEPWVKPSRVNRILDLCTGCGAIAIACAHNFPDAIVDAVDFSEDALEVAKLNVEQHAFTEVKAHGLIEKVRVIHSDLYSGVMGERYDIIVSNPPYVDAVAMHELSPEHQHEPTLALDGGVDGLDAVVKILASANELLEKEGILVCEVGESRFSLMENYPKVPFAWVDLEHGGEGVFVLTAEQLLLHRDDFIPPISKSI